MNAIIVLTKKFAASKSLLNISVGNKYLDSSAYFSEYFFVVFIKKENIGLIEVMGLAVLPPRLVPELNKVQSVMEQCLANDKKANAVYGQLTTDSTTISHADWARKIYAKLLEQGDGSSKGNASLSSEQLKKYIYDEVGIVFSHVLEDAGVFKWDEEGRAAQHRFLESL